MKVKRERERERERESSLPFPADTPVPICSLHPTRATRLRAKGLHLCPPILASNPFILFAIILYALLCTTKTVLDDFDSLATCICSPPIPYYFFTFLRTSSVLCVCFCRRKAGANFSLTAIFFTITTWSAAIDLILALALLGKTNLLKFYMEHGSFVSNSYCVQQTLFLC